MTVIDNSSDDDDDKDDLYDCDDTTNTKPE